MRIRDTHQTLNELFADLKREFFYVQNIEVDLRDMICRVMNLSLAEFVTKSHLVPQSDYFEEIVQVVKRRAAGEPLAYIFGMQNFYGLDFLVSPDVLIPRPETELLVEAALQETAALSPRILDVGTGSGCIAVTLKKQAPQAILEAWDVCEKALRIAQKNAYLHETEIYFLVKNALLSSSWISLEEKFDLIVSNPPYISFDEASSLSRDVLDHEPALALFADEKGLSFYRALAENTSNCLKAGGRLLCEIGYAQGKEVRDIFEKLGWTVRILKDYSGHDRILIAARDEA